MSALRATPPVLAIDGPVGSGKGTIAGALARRLGWHLLDSGALYRLVALQALRLGVPADDEASLERIAAGLDFRFEHDGAGSRTVLGGEDVSAELRSEAVSSMASQVAVLPRVRSALVVRQKGFRRAPGLVADGRDMGTVIFPDAELKIFLTASVQARANRRYKQLKEKGESVNLSRLLQDLEARDRRDSTREVAPLVPAQGAVVIDSTGLAIEEVVARILKLVEERKLIA